MQIASRMARSASSQRSTKKLINGCVPIDLSCTNSTNNTSTTHAETHTLIEKSTPAAPVNIATTKAGHSSISLECNSHSNSTQKTHTSTKECRSANSSESTQHNFQGQLTVNRLQLSDTNSGKIFLIDSGADVSVIPKQPHHRTVNNDVQLYAANGTVINTYGRELLAISMNSDKCLRWHFVVADVNQPIIGADFLAHHKLLIDLAGQRLIDTESKETFDAAPAKFEVCEIKNCALSSPYDGLIEKYKTITIMNEHSQTNSGTVHYILTTGPPVYARARRLSPEKLGAAKAEFEYLMQMGICRRSTSPWASPLHMVRKSDGTWRPVGDFRALNAQTIADRYPPAFMKDATYFLAGKIIFSKIDLKRAYHQIPMNEADIPKTAVITPFGLFEFIRLPFGLRNAASTMMRMMNEILADLPFLFVFFDDILVASESEDEHIQHLEKLFQRIQQHGLVINIEKCVFGQAQLNFLGHCLSASGYQPSPERVAAIREMQPPQTITDLRGFLASINFYRDFMPHAVEIQQHLSALTPGNIKNDKRNVSWTAETEQIFITAKNELANAAMLAYPVDSAPLALYSDASNTTVGGVLHQIVAEKAQPLGFYSKALTSAQRNYSTYDRELTAIYQSIKHFQYMLEGRVFVIYCDHLPLTTAFQQKPEKASPRQLRQLDFIGQFCTDIRHVAGKENIVADMLSRIASITQSPPHIIDYHQLQREQEKDADLAKLRIDKNHSLIIKRVQMPGTNALIWCDFSMADNPGRPIIPKALQPNVIWAIHGIAHFSVKATHDSVRHRFIWPHFTRKQVADIIRTCEPCQSSKVIRHTKAPIRKFIAPNERFEHINVDIIGPLPSCGDLRYCLTIIDRYTRWSEASPMPDMTATTVAQTIIRDWIARFGVPARITVDQGRQFESLVFHELNQMLGTQHLRTTSYHPQANGIIERFHRTLKGALMATGDSDWAKRLPLILLALRCALKPDIGASAAELVYGRTLRLPGEFFVDSETQLQSDFVLNLREHMRQLRPTQTAHHNTDQSFVHPALGTCTHVFIRVDRVRTSLVKPYEGPFKVLERGEKIFKVEQNGKSTHVSIDRLKPAYTLACDDGEQAAPPQIIDKPRIESTIDDGEQTASHQTFESTINNDCNSSIGAPSIVDEQDNCASPEDPQPVITPTGRGVERTTTTRYGRQTKFPGWFNPT